MFKRLILGLMAVITVVGCGSILPPRGETPPDIAFDAAFDLASPEEIRMTLIVENNTDTAYPEDEAFGGEWYLLEGDILRADGSLQLTSEIPPNGAIQPITWEGSLDPGTYTLHWGAPGHGSVVMTVDVTQGGVGAGDGTQYDAFSTPVYQTPSTPTTEPTAEAAATVEVYFSNAEESTACDAVYAVERTVEAATVEAALNQLLAGPTAAEQEEGYSSWFSEETADALISVRVEEGIAYVNLRDLRQTIPSANTSCGSTQFFTQVEETVKAANPDVAEVRYAFEGDPAPFYQWMQIGCQDDLCDPAPFEE